MFCLIDRLLIHFITSGSKVRFYTFTFRQDIAVSSKHKLQASCAMSFSRLMSQVIQSVLKFVIWRSSIHSPDQKDRSAWKSGSTCLSLITPWDITLSKALNLNLLQWSNSESNRSDCYCNNLYLRRKSVTEIKNLFYRHKKTYNNLQQNK